MSNLPLFKSKLPLFKLEDYLATREFSARYMFGSSDAETHSMAELLAMADPETKKLWQELSLEYTEAFGFPLLLEAIAELYSSSISANNVLTFSGAEEGIYCAAHALLEPQDHAIVITPCYQSLASVPASICETTEIALSHDNGWALDIDQVKQAIKPNTKLLLINYPHNPTGATLTQAQQSALIELARVNDLWIFSDEVYRFMELDSSDCLPMIASRYEKGLSLGVMSKSFGLPGLRIGWIATQDSTMRKKLSDVKHYLSICNSAPSEILALIGLRNKDTILKRNLGIMQKNIALLDDFFANYQDAFEWVRPKGGCIGFPKLKLPIPAYDFAEGLRCEKGVVVLPNTVYDVSENHFRIGFGRKNMPEALARLQDFVDNL